MHATFHEWLSSLLEKRGLSGKRLAKISGVDQSTLSKVLRGVRHIGDDMAFKIAPHLDASYVEIKAMAEAEKQSRESPESTDRAIAAYLDMIEGRNRWITLSDGKPFPPNDDEVFFMRRAQEHGVWAKELDNPSLWSVEPSDPSRVGVFEYLEDLLEVSRRYHEGTRAIGAIERPGVGQAE